MSISSEDFQDTCQTIQHQLSLYLDGLLVAQHESLVLDHLNRCTSCTKRLSLLKQVQTALQTQCDVPDLTQAVMQQFEQDINTPIPCEYDFEFISSYVDNALSSEIPDLVLLSQRIENFERHLPLCSQCNSQLGRLMDLRSSISRFHSCLEESVELDVVELVMTRYQQDTEEDLEVLPLAGCGVVNYEVFSTFVDQGYSQEDLHCVEQHLEHCAPCQQEVSRLQGLRQMLSGYGKALESAPYELESVSLWSRIEPQLSRQDNVVPLRPRTKVPWMTVISTSAVAAVFLFFVTIKMGTVNGGENLAFMQGGAPPNAAFTQSKAQIAQSADELQANQWSADTAQGQSVTYPASSPDHLASGGRESVQIVTVEYVTPEDYLFAEQTEVLQHEVLEKGKNSDYIVFADF